MKGPDALMIMIDISKVIQLLQHEVRRIIEQARPWMPLHLFKKHFISDTIKQVFRWMDLVTNIHAAFIKHIQDGKPPLCQLFETFFHKSCWPLRPWMKERPQ